MGSNLLLSLNLGRLQRQAPKTCRLPKTKCRFTFAFAEFWQPLCFHRQDKKLHKISIRFIFHISDSYFFQCHLMHSLSTNTSLQWWKKKVFLPVQMQFILVLNISHQLFSTHCMLRTAQNLMLPPDLKKN